MRSPLELSDLAFWYDPFDLSTLTIDGSNRVSEWRDKSGNGRHLTQGTVANQPVYSVVDGVPRLTFDGSNDCLKTAAIAFNQPETIQMVVAQASWTANDSLFGGDSLTDRMEVYQSNISPELTQFAGSGGGSISSLDIGELVVLTAVYNGASSLLRKNLLTPSTGDAGAQAANGFTLGARGDLGAPANIMSGEIIGRSSLAATSTYEQDRVIRYLARSARIAA